ncbi:MAG: hypothetical protein OEV28_10800, partial [Nitrospirota bacterium]|nr:hypothetical protein [Nitrospirota bacterium]
LGTINWVSVTAVVRDTSWGTASSTYQVGIKLDASTSVTGNYTSGDNYSTITSPQWTTKPGGGAWTFTDINNLVALVDKNQANTVALRITELYVTIDYTVTLNVTDVSAAPSPFSPSAPASTTISYTLNNAVAANDLVWIRIYDGTGVLKRNLLSPASYTTANKTAGANNTAWDGKNDSAAIVANGTYGYHIDAAGNMAIKTPTAAAVDVAALTSAYDTLYAVSSSNLYKSTDGGTTWATNGTYNAQGNPVWGVAVSGEGKFIYTAVRGTGVRYSKDYGVTWTNKSPGNVNVVDVACDSTGLIVYALVNQNASTKKIYKSTNGGTSWSDVTGMSTTGVDWWGVSCTPDGKIVMIIDQTTTPATSSRYFKSVTNGTSWTTSSAIAYGTGVGQLSYPNQIALDCEGGYAIADRGNHRIQKFDSSGTAVMVIGGTTAGVATDAYKFNAGTTAAFGIGMVNYDDHHMLWVADVNNSRLKKYSITDYGSSTDIIVCGTGCTDNDPPTTITDLTVGIVQQTSVELVWTAPYENRGASTGDSTLYDIRYSTIPITTENWFTATQASGLPIPGTGGTGESFAVTGLSSSTTYYFAIRAQDDAGNWSDLSNVVSATTEGMLAKAMIVYTANSSPGSLYPKDKRWTGSGWTSEYYLPAVTTTSPRNVILRTEPAGGNKRIAAIKDQGGKLFLNSWDGLVWSSGIAGGIALTNDVYRQFDVAYEKALQVDATAYRAIVVYALSAGTVLKYRVWDGAAWGDETALPAIPTTGAIRWVRLETKPGTDEIMAVWSDANSDLGAAVWTGSTNTWTVKAAVLTATLGSATEQAWDVAYESSSKDAMVAWIDTTAIPKYFTYIGTTWTGPSSATTITTAVNDFLVLKADSLSTSNQILMGIDDVSGKTLKVELWSGTAWDATVIELTGGTYGPTAAGKRAFDLEWEGKSGKAMAVYGTSAAGTTALKQKGHYRIWDGVTWGAGNWTADTSMPTGATQPQWVQLVSSPGDNEIMCGITDSTTDLNIHRWNGSIWLGRQELTMNASTTTGENFMFSYRTDAQPAVSITNPGDNYALSGTSYVVTGLASDDYGVYKVELHIERDSVPPTHWTGGQWVATEDWLRADNTLSWHYDWQLPLDNGTYTYTLTARATDNMGQVGPVSTPITGVKVYTIADPLTVYRNAATVDSSTQITANAWFSGDGNGDGSTQFETGPSATGPWTDQGSLSTETPDQQYFLRQKAISGLTAGTTYYIRITHADPDGVTGTNPEVIGPYTTKANGTTTRDITATVDDCNQVTVSASFDNDGNDNGTTAFHYSTDGTAWAAAPGCGAVAGASPRTCAVTGLVTNTTYFFKATFSDADGISGLNPLTTPDPSPYKTLAGCLTRGTTVDTLSVDNSNCRQLSVRAAYTGDQDGDSSTLVEFKKTADATWSTACSAVTGGSPRTCYITGIAGLSASTSYDVRVTWTDADGVSGSNPQNTTLSTPACGSADVFPPTLTIFRPMDGATVSGNATYPVRIEIAAYDRVALNAATLRIIVNGAENTVTANPNVSGNYYYDWTPGATGYHTIQAKGADTAGNYGYSQTFRVYVNSISVDGSGLFSGDGKLLVRENTSQLCFDCHGGIQTHSSQNLSPKYGNWAIDCRVCHTPHNTANIFLIRPVIKTPNSGEKTVDFRNTTGQADFSYATKTTPGNGPCEVCHTKTRNGDDSGRYRNT